MTGKYSLPKKKYSAFVRILHRELISATGCTEPIAIAYAAAKAVSVLGRFPEKIKVECSGNMIKNVKAVSVPQSGGMKGIASAAVLGAVGGDETQQLNVLLNVTDKQRKAAEDLVKNGICEVAMAKNTDNLYVKVIVYDKVGGYASVTIKDKHNNVCEVIKNGECLVSMQAQEQNNTYRQDAALLTVRDIAAFADCVKLEDIAEPIRMQVVSNTAIAEEGLQNPYGLQVGKTLLKEYGDGIRIRARAKASAGSDARMSGCPMPVVINSGSGNQGLTVSLPVIEYAKEIGASEERTIRALTVANLISVHQKKYIGSLSAYCGATSAAGGAVCGIAYLDGAGPDIMEEIIVNTTATIGGMVCDGAKPSCAAKISAALNVAFDSYLLACSGHCCQPGEGLVSNTPEKTIENIGRMAREGMYSTDLEILSIMLEN